MSRALDDMREERDQALATIERVRLWMRVTGEDNIPSDPELTAWNKGYRAAAQRAIEALDAVAPLR